MRFQDKLIGMHNYKASFIEGSRNLWTSSIKDHAVSNMHIRAMLLLKQERGVDLHEYAPIAKALSSMDESTHKEYTVAETEDFYDTDNA